MNSIAELRVEAARRPLAALLNHLQLASSPASFAQFSLNELRLDQFLRLDSAAVEALNLLPTGDIAKQDTIYGLLCEARTPGGQRILADWIKQPLLDKSKIGNNFKNISENNHFSIFIRIFNEDKKGVNTCCDLHSSSTSQKSVWIWSNVWLKITSCDRFFMGIF